jgi:hypothetical protein
MLLRLHAIEVPIQREKDILRYFFRGSRISEEAIGDAINAGLVPLHNVTKSIS